MIDTIKFRGDETAKRQLRELERQFQCDLRKYPQIEPSMPSLSVSIERIELDFALSAVPTPEWIAEFNRQCTASMRENVSYNGASLKFAVIEKANVKITVRMLLNHIKNTNAALLKIRKEREMRFHYDVRQLENLHWLAADILADLESVGLPSKEQVTGRFRALGD